MINPNDLIPAYIDNAENVCLILNRLLELNEAHVSLEGLLGRTSMARRSEVLKAIDLLEQTQIIKEEEPSIYLIRVSPAEVQQLEQMMQGVVLVLGLEKPKSEFDLVMTSPREPNSLHAALQQIGPKRCRIQRTDEVFADIARKAKKQLTVMTPFLDRMGADLLLDLFKATNPLVEKRLILRFLSKDSSYQRYPMGYDAINADLRDLGVSIYDYAIERENSNWLETFHAKAILADDQYAYIGSANFNQYSIDNSLELGVLLKGRSVNLVKDLVNAIVSICPLV